MVCLINKQFGLGWLLPFSQVMKLLEAEFIQCRPTSITNPVHLQRKTFNKNNPDFFAPDLLWRTIRRSWQVGCSWDAHRAWLLDWVHQRRVWRPHCTQVLSMERVFRNYSKCFFSWIDMDFFVGWAFWRFLEYQFLIISKYAIGLKGKTTQNKGIFKWQGVDTSTDFDAATPKWTNW